jgi:hypothetical protein
MGKMNSSEVFIVVVGITLILCGPILGLLYGYRVSGRAIEITLFHVLPVYRLPIDNVESIGKTTSGELGIDWSVLRLSNHLTTEGVLIKKRKGWFRRIVITPSDADEFIKKVSAQLELRELR